jgi:hypothetical protein
MKVLLLALLDCGPVARALCYLLVVGSLAASGVRVQAAAAPANPATNAAPAVVEFPRSVFADNDPAGRDPFYPNSDRRQPKPVDHGADKQPDKKTSPASLKVTGITLGEKRIATINNVTFSAGEEQDVRVPGGRVKIRCVEIRERSVIVTFQGEPEQHELVLPDKMLPIAK